MSASTPTISVIVPAHDAERYLGETLQSILDQTRAPDEVIVVDDGSTDATADIARAAASPVRLVQQPHAGTGAARNAGVAAATGNLLALCDADDVWLPNKLELQLPLIDDVDRAIAVFSGMTEFRSPDVAEDRMLGRAPCSSVPRCRLSSALLATRVAFRAAGPFLEGEPSGEWVPWCIRLSQVAEVRYADEVLFRRRLHDRNTSLAGTGRDQRWTAALRAHLRARAASSPVPPSAAIDES